MEEQEEMERQREAVRNFFLFSRVLLFAFLFNITHLIFLTNLSLFSFNIP